MLLQVHAMCGASLPREIGERFAPFQEHIRNVKTAYEILAFPHCKYQGWRDLIEDRACT